MADNIELLIQINDEVREMTKEEFDYYKKIEQEALADSEARNSARTSALAKLAALGLTEEEIAAL
jgi:hypothetical protein